jgi:hypothetical protein
MVERIREEFKMIREELDWMDPQVGRDGGEDQGGAQYHSGGDGLDGFPGRMRRWRGPGRSSISFWRRWT